MVVGTGMIMVSAGKHRVSQEVGGAYSRLRQETEVRAA